MVSSGDTPRRDILRVTDQGALRDTARDAVSPRSPSRRGFVGLLGCVSLLSVVGVQRASAAGRRELDSASSGDYAGDAGVDLAVYRAQTDRTAAVDLFYEKAQYMLEQLRSEGIVTGWRVTLYDTDRASIDNNRGGDWGSYDVHRILADEGWTDEDVALWFTQRAKVWDEDAGEHQWQTVGGGSAGYRTPFDAGTIAQGWMSTKNDDDRVVAHGASMELMHTMVDGGLAPVADCHGGHGEHSLGDAVHEYNDDYGAVGYYGSPIAAGPHTWERGMCANDVDEKDGITFTLTHCTKRAVEYTKRDRLPDHTLDVDAPCSGPGEFADRLAPGDTVHHTYRVGAAPDEVVVDLAGPADADLDLYVTHDGAAAGPDEFDRRARTGDARERLSVDGDDLGDEMGIGVHAHDGDGTYTVTVTERSADGQSPSASFEVRGPTRAGETLTFDGGGASDPDGSIRRYEWTLGDGTRPRGEVVEHSYAATGEYAVELTVTDDDGLTDTATRTVTVDEGNEPPVARIDAPDTAATGETVTFDAGPSGDPDGDGRFGWGLFDDLAYDWALGDGTEATGERVAHSYDDTGKYAVELTVTDDDGATDTATHEITVEEEDDDGSWWPPW